MPLLPHMLLRATTRPSLAAPQPKRWSDEEEAELVRLVKLHGRGSWALIEKEGADMFQGRRKQVGCRTAPPRPAQAQAPPAQPPHHCVLSGCVMSGAASGHTCTRLLWSSLPGALTARSCGGPAPAGGPEGQVAQHCQGGQDQ